MTAERAGILADNEAESDARELGRRFPPDFLWGAATSAYQIEGAVHEDGRGVSIWDRFVRLPGAVAKGQTGEVACDHYHRLDRDLDLMSAIGLRSYRFSVAWPRIMPNGRGAVNQPGVDFYRRLVEGLLERGIVPMATLYHWDLPEALQEAGGWAARDTASRFADYAAVVAEALGDRVSLWVTHNEPWVSAFLGHGYGVHAPGTRDWATAFTAAHHLLVSHGLATQAVRAAASSAARVGIVLDQYAIDAVSDRAEDGEAARRMDAWRNRWFLDPVVKGTYPADLVPELEAVIGSSTWVRDGDLELAAVPTDFLGVNYYTRIRIEAGGHEDFLRIREAGPVLPVTAKGWEVFPEGLERTLLRLRDEYGERPLYVTENGAAYEDAGGPDEPLSDVQRVAYLREHVEAVADARAAGVDVRGYFYWSLMDNFEWADGYAMRFGLVQVDFDTQERSPRASARWYRELMSERGATPAPADRGLAP